MKVPKWRRRLGAAALTSCLLLAAACTQTPAKPVEPLGGTGSWRLAFDDEFSGKSLDTKRWRTCYEYLCTNPGSKELTWYQAANLSLRDGHLAIQARRQVVRGTNGRSYSFTSGLISSHKSYRFKYAFLEARLRCATGKGLWPAFWSTPASGAWPPEVDALEAFGDAPNEVAMTYHWPATGKSTATGRSQSVVQIEPDIRQWHTYGVDIEPASITWYLDGKQRKQITDPDLLRHLGAEFYLLVNLAIAPAPNAPAAGDSFPKEMDVDYVRAWHS